MVKVEKQLRIANLAGRVGIVIGDGIVDVEQASRGRFGPSPQAVFDAWAAFSVWASRAELPAPTPYDHKQLGSPTPAPRQLFAIGLNYRQHADETGFDDPDTHPPVFTKFHSSITGPYGDVTIPPGSHVDWEVELVAVIGRTARIVSAEQAWDYVAGLTIGQDISERNLQMSGPAPQFSLAKSFPGYGPMGPHLVTIDEFDNPDALDLGCRINGEVVQKGSTKELIFSTPALVSYLSRYVTLLPGDAIFTGTPAGVGMGRTPQRWLKPGDELLSSIEGIGEMVQRFHAGEQCVS